MDFGAAVESIRQQFGIVAQAPIPFALTVFPVVLVVWKVLQWRYGGRIERLQDQLDAAREAPATTPPRRSEMDPSLPHTSVAKQHVPQEGPEAAPEERVFVGAGVTPKVLRSLCRGRTSAQSDRLVAPYIGKWMTVTGVAREVNLRDSGGTIYVHFTERGQDFFTGLGEFVSCCFSKDRGRLEIVNLNDSVTITGRICEVDLTVVSLEQCELVKHGAPVTSELLTMLDQGLSSSSISAPPSSPPGKRKGRQRPE